VIFDHSESHFLIPPSFNRPITEETLRDDDHPYVFWANLRLPVPKTPPNPMAAVYDALEEFIAQFAEEDPHFLVFPTTLSRYESVEDLPAPLETAEDLPEDIDEWLTYFPQAKPRVSGGDTYTTVLLDFSVPFPKLMKQLSHWFLKKRYGLWLASLQSEQPTSVGWLLFSTGSMDIELLKDAISDSIENVPVGLRWRTINIGLQGPIPAEQQVKALHVYVDELDVQMAKPLLMTLYASRTSPGHKFPLNVRMRLVPELDTVLNTKGRKNVDKLRACQNTWLSGKLSTIKTWEIELLDDLDDDLKMSLRDAMMEIRHPTNPKFALFHSIDKHFREKCHILTVLKSAESHAHTMIAAMLPYLLWRYAKGSSTNASIIKKWFKPAARRRAEDAFWDPKEGCVKNQSDLMLDAALTTDDDLYWEQETQKPPSPKRKRQETEEESLDDSISTVKTALSAKKTPKSVLKSSPSKAGDATSQASDRKTRATRFNTDTHTVASQVTTISQLTDMVSAVQQENKMIMSRFDDISAQLAALLVNSEIASNKRPAGGQEKSGAQT